MGERLRLAVGILGNTSSMLLYSTPMITFTRIVRKKSLGDFSCIPYVVALLNSCIYTWYGLPIVSCRWENMVMVPTNGIGILLEFSFIIIYLTYASASRRKRAATMASFVIAVFVTTALASTLALHDHRHRKILVGSVGLVVSASMYGSPLSVVKQVIKTKSVEFMPFHLSFFSFLSSTLWMFYGLLSHDIFLASPNLVGSPLGLFQLIIYCKYRKKGIINEEPPASKWDVESNGDKIKQLGLSATTTTTTTADQKN